MFRARSTQRTSPHLLILISAPAVLAVIASLWPFESAMLALTCAGLGIATVTTLLFARSVRQLLLGVTTIAILLSVATSHWPLRAAYALSRSSFERTAEQMVAGNSPQTPCWIGLFHVRKAEVTRKGVVAFWTDDDTSGPTGFVQCGPENPPFNLWSHVQLDDHWQFISED